MHIIIVGWMWVKSSAERSGNISVRAVNILMASMGIDVVAHKEFKLRKKEEHTRLTSKELSDRKTQ